MRHLLALVMLLGIAATFTTGCDKKKAETKTEVQQTTPDGTTTQTDTHTIEQKGDNPPPAK